MSVVGFLFSKSKPSQDRRYQSLERVLCQNKSSKSIPAVAVVIQNNPSLHKPPKNATKAKRNHNINRFLAELGIINS